MKGKARRKHAQIKINPVVKREIAPDGFSKSGGIGIPDAVGNEVAVPADQVFSVYIVFTGFQQSIFRVNQFYRQ